MLFNTVLFTGNANPVLAQEIATHLGVELGRAMVGRFSDGEVSIEIRQNVRARDVPIPAVYGDEVSTIKLGTLVPALLRLMSTGFLRRIMLKYVIGTFSPIALFMAVGTLLMMWSFGFGLWVLAQTIGPPEASTGTVLLCVGPALVGIQLLLSAFQLDIAATPD